MSTWSVKTTKLSFTTRQLHVSSAYSTSRPPKPLPARSKDTLPRIHPAMPSRRRPPVPVMRSIPTIITVRCPALVDNVILRCNLRGWVFLRLDQICLRTSDTSAQEVHHNAHTSIPVRALVSPCAPSASKPLAGVCHTGGPGTQHTSRG